MTTERDANSGYTDADRAECKDLCARQEEMIEAAKIAVESDPEYVQIEARLTELNAKCIAHELAPMEARYAEMTAAKTALPSAQQGDQTR